MLSVVLAAWSCGPEPATPPDGGAQTAPTDRGEGGADGADPTPAEPGPPAPGSEVEVPALHPEIDGLPTTAVWLESAAGQVEVAALVASDDPSRRRGLMEVEDLPDGVGMLFLFSQERTSGFWMWNTRVPLDIGFVAADGTLHTIATMEPCEAEQPADCPITAPDLPYVTALEVPAGWFARAGVEPGADVTWSDPTPRP